LRLRKIVVERVTAVEFDVSVYRTRRYASLTTTVQCPRPISVINTARQTNVDNMFSRVRQEGLKCT